MGTALSTTAVPKFSAAKAQSSRLAATNYRRATPLRSRYSQEANASVPLEITPGILGNHLAVQGFLQRMKHRPSAADFAAATARPGYSPSERFLVRAPHDRGLVAHIQVEPQVIRFGRVAIPTGRIRDLTVLPEYDRHGLGHRMLLHAERVAQQSGAMLMVARGENVRMLKRQGWTSIGCDPVSTVSPQRLLGQLPPPREPESPFYRNQLPKAELQIARLTHAEDLRAIYEHCTTRAYGATVRSEDYWSWLIKKGAHHRIYLYTEDHQSLSYVVVRGASVLELFDTTIDHRGTSRLLARVGADAIEQGRHTMRIHAAFSDPAHEWSDLAGGRIFVANTDESWMVKILSVRTLMRRLAAELHRRVRTAAGAPIQLGVHLGNEQFLISPGVRSMRITRGTCPDHIELTSRAVTQLLLGYRSVDELISRRALVASTDRARQAAQALFPPVDLWRNRWDDTAVIGS